MKSILLSAIAALLFSALTTTPSRADNEKTTQPSSSILQKTPAPVPPVENDTPGTDEIMYLFIRTGMRDLEHEVINTGKNWTIGFQKIENDEKGKCGRDSKYFQGVDADDKKLWNFYQVVLVKDNVGLRYIVGEKRVGDAIGGLLSNTLQVCEDRE